MSDYSKKTVAELQEILKSRALQHTGKKAELIARLQENDKSTAAAAAAEAAAAPAAPAPAEPAPEPAPEPAAAAAPAPAPVPAAEPATDAAPAAPAAAADESSKPSSDQPAPPADPAAHSPDTALAASTNYALNLPAESLDDEAARRKKRAERFGLSSAGGAGGEGQVDPEEAKKAARAEKFGTGGAAVAGLGKLNEALPTERIRGHKAAADGSLDDPGLIRRGGRGPSRGGRFRDARSRRSQHTPDRPTGVHKTAAYTSDKDRAAAEARKKRFTQAA